ncbi:hydantoinase/oxoprolinase family protein [Clostridium lacusfryxellense]|uniref:hydantoinase/oxoprolinase family protein n=1 Tax=Clostridium lacusfryxellense TaxID=205328 RepID=UPI001C0ABD09|nr:hydantoinase/oxoprolinase family protein [Clostridium lacusfryxellense]MBU3112597.1 hydantoinase/oxoprolinase family protein [Clostridium lacusfryxellense]
MGRKVRMGIDVGGTHTKAVAIDNETHDIIGKSSVKTTHDDKRGVAAGVVKCFMNCLSENNISPEDVVFVAHSTTQATNALIEGDVAKVGIIGMGKGLFESYLAKKQTKLNNIDLGNGKEIRIINSFIRTKGMTEESLQQLLADIKNQGAEVAVSSMAFGVDDGRPERMVFEVADKIGIPTTMASDITKLYGLTRRTRTAAINASILPKMLDTANSTEQAVREAGVNVPLMIMRGDGGVMEISEMKKRPVLTMLSGPAASVMGSLMYLRASNGVYFEVGGTTTNIGVIKNGRPAIDYSIVGGHPTYISSLDVQVLGCAGGSMVRANKNGIVDVGPRSAHIAGLDYSVFTDVEKVKGPQVEFFSPKPGDPSDYVAIKMENGEKVTITNSCAANVLGLVKPEHFSYGQVESARKCMQALADYCGTTVEDIAKQIMEKSYAKIEPVILGLAEKYKLEKDQISLVGVGGGAASLIIYFADKMGVKFSIPENAEVISSIGVALAMVRDAVERIIPSPSKEDIRAIKLEVMNKAIESGATAESIEIHIDIDAQTGKVTAIATGSTEVKTADHLEECDKEEAKKLAADDMRLSINQVQLLEETKYFYVYAEETTTPEDAGHIRILDTKGFIKVQRSRGLAIKTTAGEYMNAVKQLWEGLAVYKTELIVRPDFYLCMGARLMDFSATDYEQLELLMDIEVSSLEADEEIIIVAANIHQQ